MKKRALSLLMALVMVIGLLPATVLAAESVTITASYAKENALSVEPTKVTVTAGLAAEYGIGSASNSPTVLDAAVALHKAEYGDAFTSSTAADYLNASMMKLFGDNGLGGHVINGHYSSDAAEGAVLTNGDIVELFLYDGSYGDYYTAFYSGEDIVRSVDCAVGDSMTLTVKGFYLMMAYNGEQWIPLSGLNVGTVASDGTFTPLNATTDANGSVTVSFDTAGTYILATSGKAGSTVVVPAWCKVEVAAALSAHEQEAAVAADKNALALPETAEDDLTLPQKGESGKTKISWSSDVPAVISDKGVVTRMLEQETVKLTATISCGEARDTKEFTITVPALNEEGIAGRLTAAKAVLTKSALTPVEFAGSDGYGSYSYDSIEQDTNILTKALTLVETVAPGVAVSLTQDFIPNGGIASDGTITYPTDKAGTAEVSFVLTLGDRSETHSVEGITIPKHAQTKTEAISVKMDEVTLESILNGQQNTAVSTSLKLPVGSSYGLAITWTSNNTAVTIEGGTSSSTGQLHKVTQPKYGQPDAQVTLTATFDYSEMAQNYSMCDAGPMPQENTKTFTFSVPALTEAEEKTIIDDMVAKVDAAASQITTYWNGESAAAADLSAVVEDLMAPALEGYPSTTVWTSNNSEIIAAPAYSTGRMVVTRPAVGQEDATVELTVSVEKNGYTNSKTFEVTVEAWTQEELDAAKTEAEKVAEALTFTTIKGENSDARSVTKKLVLMKNAMVENDTVTFDKSNKARYDFEISWSISPGGVVSSSGSITRPRDTDKEVTLTATVKRKTNAAVGGDEDGTAVIAVTVPVIRSANTPELLKTLMDSIASTYADDADSGEWVILDMAAYEDQFPSAAAETSEVAKQAYINYAVNSIGAPGYSAAQTYSKAVLALGAIGVDPAKLYPVNSNNPIDVGALLEELTTTSYFDAPWVLLADLHDCVTLTAAQINALITLLKENQSESGLYGYEWESQFYTDADTTAYAVAALAALYNTNDVAKEVIDKAIAGLSAAQDASTGSFGNANSDAMVIVGLAAMGIDPDTDSRFVKNGKSVVDGLLSYANSSHNGFLYNGSDNALATEQGFRALVAAYQVMQTGNAYNVYDFSHNTALIPGRATGSGTVSTPGDSSGDNIRVTITIKGEKNDYWLNGKTVTIPGDGATVYHALIKALEGSGITQAGAASGYVSSMTKDGETLGEFVNETGNDGWLYKVNGSLPNMGLTEFEIKNGDTIVWYYTEDWTKDTHAGSSFVKTPTATDKKAAADVTDLIDEIGTVTKDSGEAISAARSAYDALTDEQKELVPNYDDLLEAEKKYAELVGKAFAFTDVSEDDYYYEAVKWAAEKGITSGTAETTFSPNASCTRAQMVTFLWRAAGSPEPSTNETAFGDVDLTSYYYKALLWAVENGITSGTSATTFSPDAVCTRGQMATFLYRSAETPAISDSASFTDVGESAYYKNAVLWAKAEGITAGTSATTFSPDAACTRAQMVTFLYRYLAK